MWKLDEFGSIVDENGATVVITGVATPSHANNKEALKNRNLLLAAPELLEALQDIYKLFTPQSQEEAELCLKVESAIAKVKGETK